VDYCDERAITIADVLSGRVRVTAPMTITAQQRLYFNYRFDQPSCERGMHGPGGSSAPRDFRSRRERERDE